ncbi:MAG: hypothetical protein HY320_01410 [Armatimonadetes bacterium]|nr:hypothetical protein [Armatimonadota bacterium]
MTPHIKPPCRLYVILARKAPVAAVFRRGPSKWVQLIKWHTATDTFEQGQWFHGRIYERRSDLSPSGSNLIYFAAQYHRHLVESFCTWTVVSKLPSLTALALWPNTMGTWYGGGLFVTENRLVLNTDRERPAPDEAHRPPRYMKVTARPYDVGGDGLQDIRLARDGWSVVPEPGDWLGVGPQSTLRNRSRKHREFRLVVTITHEGFSEREIYELLNPATPTRIELPEVTWADWDQQGRFVFARGGRLFSGRYAETGRLVPEELADFNNAEPEPVEAPEWMKVW